MLGCRGKVRLNRSTVLGQSSKWSEEIIGVGEGYFQDARCKRLDYGYWKV